MRTTKLNVFVLAFLGAMLGLGCPNSGKDPVASAVLLTPIEINAKLDSLKTVWLNQPEIAAATSDSTTITEIEPGIIIIVTDSVFGPHAIVDVEKVHPANGATLFVNSAAPPMIEELQQGEHIVLPSVPGNNNVYCITVMRKISGNSYASFLNCTETMETPPPPQYTNSMLVKYDGAQPPVPPPPPPHASIYVRTSN